MMVIHLFSNYFLIVSDNEVGESDICQLTDFDYMRGVLCSYLLLSKMEHLFIYSPISFFNSYLAMCFCPCHQLSMLQLQNTDSITYWVTAVFTMQLCMRGITKRPRYTCCRATMRAVRLLYVCITFCTYIRYVPGYVSSSILMLE